MSVILKTNMKDLCKVIVKENLGRHLVATRSIKRGELLLLENPLVIGPHTDSSAVCLNCWVTLPPFPFAKTCPRCKIAPLCANCAALDPPEQASNDDGLQNKKILSRHMVKHDIRECDAFLNSKLDNRTLMNNMQIVMPLRCLLLDEENFQEFLKMEAHMHERRDSAIWKAHQINVIEFLNRMNLTDPGRDSGDLLQQICGILDVNSFELRAPSGNTSTSRGLYPEAALLSHDCVANAHITLDANCVMQVYASQDIPENSPLFFNYTNVLQPTWKRREHLREGKYFECFCERCRDPTELGSCMGSVMCFKCGLGQMLPMTPTSATPWAVNNVWKCVACESNFPASLVKEMLDKITDSIEDIDKSDERAIEVMLKQLSKSLPPRHYIIVQLKQILAGVLRDIIEREIHPPKRYLQKKLDICQEMVDLLMILEPGISRLRGIALYEVHVCKTQLANREYDSQDINSSELLERLQEAEVCLRTAISLLVYEPSNTPEGNLTKRAFNELRLLKDTITGARGLVQRDAKRTKHKRPHKKNI